MRILAINLGWEQEPLLQKLAQKDVEIYGIHYNSDYIKSVKFKEVKIFNLRDLNLILNYAISIKPDGVISDNCDYSLFAQALIAQKLNLPSPSLKAAQLSNNKYLQRTIAQKAGFLVPKFQLCSTLEELIEFTKTTIFPIITKPVDNRGSFGVKKISSFNELEDAFYEAITNSHSRLILAEEFIQGTQVTIDGYAFKTLGAKSLAIGDKILISADGEVATTISYPSDFSQEVIKNAFKNNEEINKTFNYDFGMTHSEYMINNDGIYLIESTNRGGGVFTSAIVAPNVCGIDLLEEYVNDCLNIDKNLYKTPQNNPTVLKFFRFNPGKISIINGYEKIKNDKRVIRSDIFVKSGDYINSITNDANRHGFIIFKGTNEQADILLKEIEVLYEK